MADERYAPLLSVRVGELLVVTLEEDRSSGFTVCLTGLPACLALASGEQVASESRAGCTKLPGVRRFTFIGTEAGEGELTFNKISIKGGELRILESDSLESQRVCVVS